MRRKKKFAMLAAGTGINPLLSIAQASILSCDGVEIVIIYSNKTKNDILCKPELDALCIRSKYIKIHYTLTRHSPLVHGNRAGLVGRISTYMMEQCEFPTKPDKYLTVLVCGPHSFETDMLKKFISFGFEHGKDLINIV